MSKLGGKLESELEINAPAKKYYEFFKDQCFHAPKVCSQIVKNVEVHEGDWDSHCHGSVKIWNYTVDGKHEVLKEQVEFYDKELKMVQVGLDGDVFNRYKIFNVTYQVVPKGPNHSLVKLTLEYEKLSDEIPCPNKYLDLMIGVTKDIESHLKC